MEFVILAINAAEGWVKIDFTGDDGERRVKSMMADVTSIDTIRTSVAAWYNQYAVDRAVEIETKSPPPEKAVGDAVRNGTRFVIVKG